MDAPDIPQNEFERLNLPDDFPLTPEQFKEFIQARKLVDQRQIEITSWILHKMNSNGYVIPDELKELVFDTRENLTTEASILGEPPKDLIDVYSLNNAQLEIISSIIRSNTKLVKPIEEKLFEIVSHAAFSTEGVAGFTDEVDDDSTSFLRIGAFKVRRASSWKYRKLNFLPEPSIKDPNIILNRTLRFIKEPGQNRIGFGMRSFELTLNDGHSDLKASIQFDPSTNRPISINLSMKGKVPDTSSSIFTSPLKELIDDLFATSDISTDSQLDIVLSIGSLVETINYNISKPCIRFSAKGLNYIGNKKVTSGEFGLIALQKPGIFTTKTTLFKKGTVTTPSELNTMSIETYTDLIKSMLGLFQYEEIKGVTKK